MSAHPHVQVDCSGSGPTGGAADPMVQHGSWGSHAEAKEPARSSGQGREMPVKLVLGGRHQRSIDKASWRGPFPVLLLFLFGLLFERLLSSLGGDKLQGRAWRR